MGNLLHFDIQRARRPVDRLKRLIAVRVCYRLVRRGLVHAPADRDVSVGGARRYIGGADKINVPVARFHGHAGIIVGRCSRGVRRSKHDMVDAGAKMIVVAVVADAYVVGSVVKRIVEAAPPELLSYIYALAAVPE